MIRGETDREKQENLCDLYSIPLDTVPVLDEAVAPNQSHSYHPHREISS